MQDKVTIKLFLVKAGDHLDLQALSLARPQRLRALTLKGKRQIEYSLGRLLLTYALNEAEHQAHRIIENEQGGPSVILDRRGLGHKSEDSYSEKSYSAPKFSISHSKGWVGLVYADAEEIQEFELELGLDIEKIKEGLDERQASYFCNEQQIAVAQKLTPVEKADYFTRLWTHKEAYCKSQGLSVLSQQSKAADFRHDKHMRSGLLDNTHFLSLYSNTKFVLKTHFLELRHRGEVTDTSEVTNSPDLKIGTARRLSWESNVSAC